MKARFSVDLRGEECEVEATVLADDPEVGIMAPYADEWEIVEPEEARDWQLTDEEVGEIQDRAVAWYYDDPQDR